MKNNKIFIASEIFPPEIGGPATYTLNLANELAKKDFKVRVLTYGENKQKFLFPINYVSRKSPFFLMQFIYFLKLLKFGWNFDIIFAQGPSVGPATIFLKWLRLGKTKVIVKFVGDQSWQQINFKENKISFDKYVKSYGKKWFGLKIFWIQKWQMFSFKNADQIITPSYYLKNKLIELGIEEEKIKVIYNSVAKINIEKQNKNPNLIISIARLVPWKGVDLLIKIMPELLKINPDFKLLICGSGPEKQNLQNLILKLKLEKNIEIKKCNHQEVLKYLSQAELFVLNTGYEGLSHTILEAMFSEIPIITTNVGGNLELIKNNENGILVEYNNKKQIKDAILKLHNNPELQQKFIQNAKKDLDKFSFENMINKTIEVLKK